MTKGGVWYTNNKPDENIFFACQKQLEKCQELLNFPIYSISQKPIDFGINTVMELESSLLSMYKQIVEGVTQCQTDIVFLLEHDLLYHPSHFDTSSIEYQPNYFYYNRNQWHVHSVTGKTVTYLHNDTSMLSALREPLLAHMKRAVEVNETRFHSHYGISPPKGIPPEEQRGKHYATYMSAKPVVDIRHPNTLTRVRMTKDQFRNAAGCRGWTEGEGIPEWPGKTLGRFDEWLKEVVPFV
jgi:hypothetical protein